MSNENINDLPPDSVSTQQLLMMVRDLRAEQRSMKEAEIEWRTEINNTLLKVSNDMKVMSDAFDQGKTTIRVLKWLAAIATGALALYEAIRRMT